MTASQRTPEDGGRETGRLFRVLLAFFPRAFRAAFGTEMCEVFAAQRRLAAAEGGSATVRLWARTVAGMLRAAWRERRSGSRVAALPAVTDWERKRYFERI